MTMETARSALVTRLEAEWATRFPNVALFYENATLPNLATRVDPFMQIDFDLREGQQTELSTNPRKRVYASAYFAIFQKEGTGTKTINQITDYLIDTFTAVSTPECTTTTASAVKAPVIPGWYGKVLSIDFYYFTA